MRILLISQFYAPEVTAARVRVQAFAEGLAAKGHEAEVICEVPNHPSGVVEPGYRGSFSVRREENGVHVRHVWVRARPEKTTANRLLFYGTFAASATVAGIASRAPDVVLVSSPPLPAGAAAAAVARRHRVPWVFDVRDIWPEAAVVLGELRGERAIRAAERLERGLYRSARAIVTVTAPFAEQIAAKVESPGKITVIPNGTSALWMDAGAAEPDRKLADLSEKEFVWAYAGNLGIAQGLESAIDAAELLGDGFRFLVIGDGPRMGAVQERAVAQSSAKVEFRGLMEPERAAATLRACDALLVPLADKPELAKFIPSKLFDCCAIGRPLVVAAEGESRRLVHDAGAALTVPPEDPTALAEAIRRLRDDHALAGRLSEGARAFAAENLREKGVERLEELLFSVINRGR
jgi:colanic acid biosynthesis glycosyl transferase WcaI